MYTIDVPLKVDCSAVLILSSQPSPVIPTDVGPQEDPILSKIRGDIQLQTEEVKLTITFIQQ